MQQYPGIVIERVLKKQRGMRSETAYPAKRKEKKNAEKWQCHRGMPEMVHGIPRDESDDDDDDYRARLVRVVRLVSWTVVGVGRRVGS